MSEHEPTYASAASVAGLASEVDSLRRRVEPLQHLPGRVQQVAELVDELAGTVQELTAQPTATLPPSWLLARADSEATRGMLDELTTWLGQVLLRYVDAAAVLPECWVWHPEVVEELLWLMHAWLAAYQGPKASVALVGDWHDRYRPGVVRRISKSAGSCSLENHTPSSEPATVPGLDAVPAIAEWWAHNRDMPAPEPSDEQLTATPRRRAGGARR